MTRNGADGGHRWPLQSWQFWCGLLAGIGLGLLLGAALVELELLTLHRKAWVSVLGILFFGVLPAGV
jgi:hypothetical protein